MLFRSHSSSLRILKPRSPAGRARLAANRSRVGRRLLLEGLEDRRLLAFNVMTQYDIGPTPSALLLAQFDSGSPLDLVVANDLDNHGSVRLGNADGTFNSPQSTGTAFTSVAVGDLTGNGFSDLVATGTHVILQEGSGDGTFGLPLEILLPAQVAPGNPDPAPLPQSLRSIATGDLNDDGKLDLVVAGQTSFSVYHRYYACGYYSCGYIGRWNTYTDGYVNVLIGDGSGGFAEPVVYPLGTDRGPGAIAIGDLNDDGHADVLTANNHDLSALLGDSTGSLAAPIHSGSGYGSGQRSLSLGDLDGDGYLDTITHGGNSLTVQKGQGNGSFVPVTSIDMGHAVDSAVVGDVNGDGQLDLVAVGSTQTCNYWGYYGCYDYTYSGQASVVLGDGQGSFSLPIASPLGTDFQANFVGLTLADITGNGSIELVTVERQTGIAIVAANDGNWILPVALSISSPSIVEGNVGNSDAVFTVTLASPSSEAVSVDFATADLTELEQYWYQSPTATADVDYIASSGTLIIPAGETTGMIVVPIIGDRVGETNESFFVNLNKPVHAHISSSKAVGTVIDDEPFVWIVSDGHVLEGDAGTTPATFTVHLSAAYDAPVTVDFATLAADAVAGSDYIATTGSLIFAAGQTSLPISVPVVGDLLEENDEHFYVDIASTTASVINNGYGVVYILNDDAPPALSIGDAALLEGNSGTRLMTFTVSLSAASGVGVWVDYATANGTASISNKDYVATSGSLYFAPGETSQTLVVSIIGDAKKEKDERFYVRLSGAVGATIADAQGVGTILNDDGGSTGKNGKPSAAAFDLALDDLMDSKRLKRSR